MKTMKENACTVKRERRKEKQYCMEGTEMRQLVFRSTDIYYQKLNNQKCTLTLFLYANRKKGKQANSKRDRERECVREPALWNDGH
jgi:hypothetical protein